ncbi:hypothetical protein Pmar_PMAR012893 [Perkinsus marinus ATCC 50983]|uniref:CW-type domain-containing protein n=1 Tax=Perkinsus marinus (strain ATCC 50983 / TXsc) TaxID=423536 RepID=C5LWG6_PERM5|nr:hypothetical protein Pmar_PMAR012893 [Perkinsus marinus ATCC 50983]EEQ98879.1 hypothetical protein Pmar_PMAR012893 [Perkinsus marinus ATCC 50983]|eukprot:XP_002766162.1 hypothetical protein Pmar_PMAR012893 [Perkinsus marinus ATCC 50983]
MKKVMSDCVSGSEARIKKVTFFADSEITIHRLRAWRSGSDQWIQGMKAKIKDGAVMNTPGTRGFCIDEDVDLSPMDMFRAYAPRRLLNNLGKDEIVDKLHMIPPDVPSVIQDFATQVKSNQEVKYREYRRLWELRRSESFEKVLGKIQQHREFSLGDIVYRWRPAESKLCPSWDGPWEIVRFLGKTRVILRLLKDTRIEGYESVNNLKKASRDGSEVDAMVDYWMECSRCGKWRMTTKEDCEKYAAVDDEIMNKGIGLYLRLEHCRNLLRFK